uniref:TFIIIC_sub6 domain-containing protein n=1 Tax=Strongyloides venezuelensis TaxID=75913 RepID=A0A0K0G4U6_STRVS
MDQLGCTHIFSVLSKSETNGVAERHIRIVKEGLYKFKQKVKGEDEDMSDNSPIKAGDGDCSSERGKLDDENVFVDLEGESYNEKFSIAQISILLQPNESLNTISSEEKSVFNDLQISVFDFGKPLDFERTLEQRDLKASCKLNATPVLGDLSATKNNVNLFNSDDELEEYIKKNKVKILAGVDGSALIGRGAGYTIEWCETGHSVDGDEENGKCFIS